MVVNEDWWAWEWWWWRWWWQTEGNKQFLRRLWEIHSPFLIGTDGTQEQGFLSSLWIFCAWFCCKKARREKIKRMKNMHRESAIETGAAVLPANALKENGDTTKTNNRKRGGGWWLVCKGKLNTRWSYAICFSTYYHSHHLVQWPTGDQEPPHVSQWAAAEIERSRKAQNLKSSRIGMNLRRQ